MLTEKNGWLKERYQYDIWGKAFEDKITDRFPGYGLKGNLYGFTGQRYQPELGVYAFAYRDYSPRTMRWLTEDPVRDGLNWYRYCNNSPVRYIDRTGLAGEEALLLTGWGVALGEPTILGEIAMLGISIVYGIDYLADEVGDYLESRENTEETKNERIHLIQKPIPFCFDGIEIDQNTFNQKSMRKKTKNQLWLMNNPIRLKV